MTENQECDDCHAQKGTICSDMDCPGKRAKAGKPEHLLGASCWCEPERWYTDPETGVTVWVHKAVH